MANHEYTPYKEIRIELYITDAVGNGMKTFFNTDDFREYLMEHPKLRHALTRAEWVRREQTKGLDENF